MRLINAFKVRFVQEMRVATKCKACFSQAESELLNKNSIS